MNKLAIETVTESCVGHGFNKMVFPSKEDLALLLLSTEVASNRNKP